jgi:hypothetical protein
LYLAEQLVSAKNLNAPAKLKLTFLQIEAGYASLYNEIQKDFFRLFRPLCQSLLMTAEYTGMLVCDPWIALTAVPLSAICESSLSMLNPPSCPSDSGRSMLTISQLLTVAEPNNERMSAMKAFNSDSC